MISYDHFTKLEIKIATIASAEIIEGADKLIKLIIDLGDEKRQLVAGIAKNHTCEELVGKQVPVLTNLEPREIRGVLSHGMILAVDEKKNAILIHPEKQVENGSVVR